MSKNKDGATKKEDSTKDAWDWPLKRFVRGLYGTVVGCFMIYNAFSLGSPLFADGDLTVVEAIFLGSIIAVGAIASLPWIFMPIFADVLKAWKARKEKSA